MKKYYKEAKAFPVKDETFCAYIGPSATGIIQRGTIYPQPKDETVKALSAVIAKYPLIADLIIPGSELGRAAQEVKTPGTRLYVKAKKVFKA